MSVTLSENTSIPYSAPVATLAQEAKLRPPQEAAALIAAAVPEDAAAALTALNPGFTQNILAELSPESQAAIHAAASPDVARQWRINEHYGEGAVGRLMEPVYARFPPDKQVQAAVDALRALVKTRLITYAYVVDDAGRMAGILTMRDLLFAESDQTLQEVMIAGGFSLRPELPVAEAMRLVLDRHYPAYPVCDADGVLLGLVRGQAMFEERTFEITAQAGSMVGVEREERLSTPLIDSLKMRHPWLQINLLTAFLAAAVVGAFQGTIDRLVILAVFLPVLAGQSGNTGCQALAVTLRGMTLGELKPGSERRLVIKEATLGLFNGLFVGISAGFGMYVVATLQHSEKALTLALVVVAAMILSCVMSGISGALVPFTLKKLGFDPATASSIFLTTATDVVSMGTLLGLATILVR